jgi:hypothetical protein
MSMRRFFLLAVATLLFAGASVSPANMSFVKPAQTPVVIADDGDPLPQECGFFDLCKVPQTV